MPDKENPDRSEASSTTSERDELGERTVQDCERGDELTASLVEYHTDLSRYASQHAPELDADDLASSVLESTLAARRAGNGPLLAPKAYLYTSLRRRIAQERSVASRLLSLQSVDADHLPAHDNESAVQGDSQSELLGLLAEYPPRDRFLLVERFVNDSPLKSIAVRLGLSVPQTSRRIYKLKMSFRARWVQRHVRVPDAPRACHAALLKTGTVLAGVASSAAAKSFWDHVEKCPDCSRAVREAGQSMRFPYLLFTALPAVGLASANLVVEPSPSSAAATDSAGVDDASNAGSAAKGDSNGTMPEQTPANRSVRHRAIPAAVASGAGAVLMALLFWLGMTVQPGYDLDHVPTSPRDALVPAVPDYSAEPFDSPHAPAAEPESAPPNAPAADTSQTGSTPPAEANDAPTPAEQPDLHTCGWSGSTLCYPSNR